MTNSSSARSQTPSLKTYGPAEALCLLVFVLLLAMPVQALGGGHVWWWITGAAVAKPDYMRVSLYVNDDPVGTANIDSNGRARAVLAGETMRIEISDARQDGNALTNVPVTIRIRQGSTDVITLTAQITDGSSTTLFEIPASWSGNYHIDTEIPDTKIKDENEFKVQGFGCVATAEVCDGIDNDCDGAVDDTIALRSCGTSDVGVCKTGTQECQNGYWTECKGAVLPDVELCDNIDNNCNGLIDENMQKDCGSDVGACTKGISTCSAGQWGVCVGGVGPTPEACDGIDNNCNGIVDEGCECKTGDVAACGSNIGECRQGTHTCVNGNWELCTGGQGSQAEVCDGKDNDCSGKIDDGLTEACGVSNVGECTMGTRTCSEGSWNTCIGAVLPRDEVCDGLDNDCDGQVDESLSRSCGSGGCLRGSQQCTDGRWGICSDTSGPSSEVCDGIDNNCDGRIDEGLVKSCGSDIGSCNTGVQQCVNAHWGVCSGESRPSPEACNGIDDDCNGKIDDGITCDCTDGQTEACGSNVGECRQGTWMCSGGVWGQCKGANGPTLELCDGKDNNCDGQVDNGIILACGKSTIAPCQLGVQLCVNGALTSCQGTIDPSPETCNGIDDNCNDMVDEGVCECRDGDTKSCKGVGTCAGGVSHCDHSMWGACVGAATPQPEICNGIDDNCNGVIDENMAQVCGSDIGACKSGIATCSAGTYGACVGSKDPTPELCNGIDDNCDGLIDNGIDCACKDGDTQSCGKNVGTCILSTQTCMNGQWGECNGVQPSPEVCDGVDNNCDGIVDNLLPRTCGESDIGACTLGTQSCEKGTWGACTGAVGPIPETCDGIDNNCNGEVDESLTRSCGGKGACAGAQVCNEGMWDMCIGSAPSPEVCDGVDNNCDGVVDEGCGTTPLVKAANITAPIFMIRPGKQSNPAQTCQGVDCATTPRGSARLAIQIIDMPQHVDATDAAFGVEAIVRNNGSMALPNVVVDATSSMGWSGESVPVGSLDPGQQKPVTLSYHNTLCPPGSVPSLIVPSDVAVTLRAHSGDIADQKSATREVRSPALGVLTTPDGANLRTCVVVGNQEQPAKSKLEVELEVFDQKKDLVVDLLSPLRVGANETLLSVHDYPLRNLEVPKVYHIRANLYENGSIFSKGYTVAQMTGFVDLSHMPLQQSYSLWDRLQTFMGVFG